MRDPRFTLGQVAIAIAVIGLLLAVWVQALISSVFLVIASMPAVAAGFVAAAVGGREIERILGYSMRTPLVLLTLILAGLGCAGLAIAILVSIPLDHSLIVVLSILALLGFVIYQVTQGPLWFRLTIEGLTIVALLALSAWTWQPPDLIRAAARADALAAQVSKWAEESNAPETRDVLRRESDWFRRRAFSLRSQACWKGLIQGPSSYYSDIEPYDTDRLLHEL